MRTTTFLSVAAILFAVPSFSMAGDVWEISSSSTGPDGRAVPFTHEQCIPSSGADPSSVLGGLGVCSIDRKSGDDRRMFFSMTCVTPGMPPGLGSMRVDGEASMTPSEFSVGYVITVGGDKSLPGGDFKMSGSARARKTGRTCRDGAAG